MALPPHKMSVDMSFQAPPVVAPFAPSETSPTVIIDDPRPRTRSFKIVPTSDGPREYRMEWDNGSTAPQIDIENPLKVHAPLECVLEALSTKAKNRQVISEHRIIKIDDLLLDVLRRISPPSLGGNKEVTNEEEEKKNESMVESSPYAERRNAWTKRLETYFDPADLIALHDAVRAVTDSLPTSSWKLPKNHDSFRIDGGWELYVLKLHQLILCTLSKEDPDLKKKSDYEVEAEKRTAERLSALLNGDMTASLTETSRHIQTNLFEARTLWNAAVRAATAERQQRAMQEGNGGYQGYGDNAYRDYHRTNSRLLTSSNPPSSIHGSSTAATNNISHNATSTVGAMSTTDHINTQTTATPAGSDSSPDSSNQNGMEEEPEDLPINPPTIQPIRNTPVLVQHDVSAPMDVYVTLMDGATRYYEVPGLQQPMPAIIDPPINQTTQKPSKVAFIYPNIPYQRAMICLDLDLLSFGINSGGRYDAYLWSLFIHTIFAGIGLMHWFLKVPPILKSVDMMNRRACHALRVFRACITEERWSIAKVEYLSHMLMSTSPSAVNDTMNELIIHIWHSAFHRNDVKGLKRLEGMLVALLGHSDTKIRGRAAILLNMFYDGHDWQQDVPFVPVIKQVGDAFEVTVCVDDKADPKKGETPEGVVLILSAPSFDPESPYESYTYHSIDWLPTESVKGRISGVSRFPGGGPMAYGRSYQQPSMSRHRWIGSVKFQNFTRCGFFDWRVVRMNEAYGSWETVRAALNDIRRSASSSHLLDLRISLSPEEREASPDSVGDKDHMIVGKVYPHPQRMAEVLKGILSPHAPQMFHNEEHLTFPLQGRFVVQPRGISDEQVHEIFIDQHGCEFDKNTGKLTQRGSFASVTASLSDLRDKGVTMVYLMGALSRDNGEMHYLSQGGVQYEREDASPFAVTCRCTPNSMSGGASGLQTLLAEAKRVGIKVLVDSLTRVSSSRSHRKYEPHMLHHIDDEGKKQVLYGSGGRAANYEDTVQLNYRKVECWDLMVADMKVMSNIYSVDGLRLESCQSWPPILSADMQELTRRDPDGVGHYNIMDQLLAEVVIPFSEESSGFWGTHSARNWSNPFLVKLCKEVWRDRPEFVLVGECFGSDRGDDRQCVLARSGVIPQLQDMPEPLARVFGQAINEEDSTVSPCEPAGVQEIINWFDSAHNDLPEGAVVIQSSCSHLSPLPGLLYGRGAWPAVDLLFFLPDIPSTFSGEMEGHCFRLDITNVFTASTALKDEDVSPGGKSIQSRAIGYRSTAARSLVNLMDVSSPERLASSLRTSGPKPMSAVRTLGKFESIAALPMLEEEQVKKIGPEFGFDLKQIGGHYAHRRRLRHRLKLLRSGILVPLGARHNDRWHPRVLAFLRFDPETGEFVLVGINFSDTQLDNVTVSLKALGFQFRDMGLESTTTFVSADLFAITQTQGAAQDRSDSKLLKIGSHRELGQVPLMGGQNTLGKIFTFSHSYNELYSMAELLHKPQVLNLKPYGSVCLGFKPVEQSELKSDMITKLYSSSLARLQAIVKGSMAHAVVRNEPIPSSLEKVLRFNFTMEAIMSSIVDNDLPRFASVLVNLRNGLKSVNEKTEGRQMSLHDLIVDSGLFCSEAQRFDPIAWMKLCCREGGGAAAVLAKKDERTDMAEKLVAKMMAVADKIEQLGVSASTFLTEVKEFARQFVVANDIGPIVFVTTELGQWSTVGGLGVMVDELSCTLAEHLGQTVYIVTPYYNYDRKGQPAQMDPREVQYKSNINITVGGESIELGVHEGRVRGVNLIFLHNARFFPHPYPAWNVPDGLRFLSVIGKAALEVLCQKRLIPQLIVTNDWPTGLVAAYGKNSHFFGDSFRATTFFHIVHNLDANYEGRLYADRGSNYAWITELAQDLLVDPTWQNYLYNPSRCALLCSDAWGTVSPSYRDELKRPGGSALTPLLNRYPMPFAYPNGVPLKPRLKRLSELKFKNHAEAKAEIQRKYFKFEEADLSIPLFAFIGRITEQKGVHHIVDAAEQLIQRYQCKIQILIGGKVNWSDPYSAYCGHKMDYLRYKYPFSVWANPNEFFSDGPLVNVGADVSLMPSKFEPGGIVQHEFFIAGTPVLAFRTGGLRDTVYEFDIERHTGNGWTFEAYQMGDFLYAMERAYRVVSDPYKYEKIRENAKFSVISCEQVAQAWLIEFCRLRRKLPVDYGRLSELSQKYASTWDPIAWAESFSSSPSISVAPSALPSRSNSMEKVAQQQSSSPTSPSIKPISPSSPERPIPAERTASLSRSHKAENPGLVPARIRYSPKPGIRPRAVAVSGSFDDWQVRRPMVWDNAIQAFSINLALRPGRYVYKLIVDGDWTLNPEGVGEKDSNGNYNNMLEVGE